MTEDKKRESPVSVSQMAGSRYDILDCKVAPDVEAAEVPVDETQGSTGYIHSF